MKKKLTKEQTSDKEKYSQYKEETQEFMENVEKFLVKKYDKLQPEWQGQLNILATNYDMFLEAKRVIKHDGLSVLNRFGGVEKHPLVNVMKDCNIQIIKLCQNFGLNPYSKARIKDGTEGAEEAQIISDLLG